MPHYFFHSVTDRGLQEDKLGADCKDDNAACEEGRRAIKEMMGDSVRIGDRVELDAIMRVQREDGSVVCELPYGREIDLRASSRSTSR